MAVKVERMYQYDAFGPNTLDWIEDNLWIGNLTAAINLDIILDNNISRILTVDTWPLPKSIYDDREIETMYIPVTDLPTEDLISYFEGAYKFIEGGMKEGSVLVHCYQGVSRSATVLLAYLMRKHDVCLEKAFDMVRYKRKVICPNESFLAQLKLYDQMGRRIDPTHLQYRMFRLFIASDRFRTNKYLLETYADVIQPDPYLEVDRSDPKVYRCKKCRRIVASESNRIPHFPRDDFTWRDERYLTGEGREYYCEKLFFIEPLSWMHTVANNLSGKLHCPNQRCQTKLGSFCWNTGSLCPCGTKVCPGFYLVPSKVDRPNLEPEENEE